MQQPGSPPNVDVAQLRERYTSLFQVPDLLPWQLDVSGKRLLLALVTEGTYRDASFLDQRLNLDGKLQAMWVPLERMLADQQLAGLKPAEAGFIFHVGHCGSTLLSRLLSENPDLLSLREPLSLRALAESERLLERPGVPVDRTDWQASLGLLSQLLGRTYRHDQKTVIKPSSSCNNLLEPVLASHPGHRAIFLYLNPRAYLANVLRPQSRGALHAFSGERTFDVRRFMPHAGDSFESLAPGRLGILNWSASMAYLMHAKADANLSDRIRVVEFEDFLQDPVDILEELFRFLGKPVNKGSAVAIAAGAHMQRYAKDPSIGYTPELRAEDLRRSMEAHRADIEDALTWLEELLDRAPALTSLKEVLVKS